MSEESKFAAHVYVAITSVTETLAKTGISKSRNNAQQGYKFRGIDEVYNALAGVLAGAKLCVLPRVVAREHIERTSKNGSALNYTILEVEFDLVSSIDGSKHTIRTVGEAMDSADKSSNKAMSAAMKYAMLVAFQIPTEGDNDADAHTPEPAPRRAAPRNDAAPPNPFTGDPDVMGKMEELSVAIAGATAVDALMRVYADVMNSTLPTGARDVIKTKLSARRQEIEKGRAA